MITRDKTQVLNGAESVIKTLISLGVDTIFGYPGGVVLSLYDELYKQNKIKHVLVRHEQSAVHAAEGYCRTTGKCGVVLVTSGPGATNTITGLVNAYLDGHPLIILTGQVYTNLIGSNAFQEANICDMAKSCTKAVYQIKKASDIQSTLIEAFSTALSGKKGPVLVDMARDIFTQCVNYEEDKLEEFRINTTETNALACSYICDCFTKYSKPVIVAGGGVIHSGASKELYNFAKHLKIPVVSTMMGLGSFPQDDESYFGMIGIFGDNSANEIIRRADVVLSLGVRWNDRIACVFNDIDLTKKIIKIDIDINALKKTMSPNSSLSSDIKDFLSCSNLYTNNKGNIYLNWLEESQKLKKENKLQTKRKISNLLHSFEVLDKIEEFTKSQNIIFTSEVGQHQLFAVKCIKQSPQRRLFVSGGSGTMGFGLPAAIGASIAKPENPVVCITGDGSFQMSLHELATCKDYNLNLKIMILNNGYLGMVRQLQQKEFEQRYSETKISNPDFVKLAQSYGIDALNVSSLNEVESALNKAFSTNKTFIINFAVEPMEIV